MASDTFTSLGSPPFLALGQSSREGRRPGAEGTVHVGGGLGLYVPLAVLFFCLYLAFRVA